MKFTLTQLLDSIGGALKESYPDVSVYSNPNQQGTDVPCFLYSSCRLRRKTE